MLDLTMEEVTWSPAVGSRDHSFGCPPQTRWPPLPAHDQAYTLQDTPRDTIEATFQGNLLAYSVATIFTPCTFGHLVNVDLLIASNMLASHHVLEFLPDKLTHTRIHWPIADKPYYTIFPDGRSYWLSALHQKFWQ